MLLRWQPLKIPPKGCTVWQTKPRIKIGFLWQIICPFSITTHLLPLFLFVCHTHLDCKPFNSALYLSAAWLDGGLTWIVSWSAYTLLIILIIIDFTGLWINFWRNTFASHCLSGWNSACVLSADDEKPGWGLVQGPVEVPCVVAALVSDVVPACGGTGS